ncbi:hypothetical protein [Natrialba sp. INN-245]|uniref:hypothetical protein n=1 Tax=Natrialba sp. INN-245 TaxID=2690967 RepID=UPI0013134DD3|nr:hypothetical protein [Natrialba sp. INN-245]MWV38322.1 hypothetical protein [Natrialba sp. INN-245]
MTDTEDVRRRLVGGGVIAAGSVVVLVVLAGIPTTLAEAVPVVWIAVGGGMLILAGRLERLSLGVTAVGWPRIGAVGLAILALGSSTVGFVQLLEASGWGGLLNAVFALGVALILAFGALECWFGGLQIDEDAFVVEA